MSIFDRFLGRGDASVTVPVMDGPFLPNQRLETADVVGQAPEADNLVHHRGALLASSGATLLRSEDGAAFEKADAFDYKISALASSGDALAIGLDGQGIRIRGGQFDGALLGPHSEALRCVTALAWLNDHELAVCNGSQSMRPHEWRRSLMRRDASGSILKVDVRGGALERLTGGLAWPSGLVVARDRLYASESWRHRIVSVPLTGGPAETILGNLPAYPARIAKASAGGYWIAFYSVRNQLVEFILEEPRYRERMLAEIPEAFWMAPSLSSGHSPREPMQGSQLKQMGILKPYSASRSYGLVAYCDGRMTPLGSLHSRAGGRRHGVVACCEVDGRLFVASKGSGAILSIDNVMSALTEQPE